MNRQNIVRSFQTILEMLSDRGEDIGDVTSQHMDDILKQDDLKSVIEVIINDIKIIYYKPPKVKSTDIKKYFEDKEPYRLYILVIQENITQNNMKFTSSLNVPIEVHTLNRLQFNITKHSLVPKHEVIRDKRVIDDLVEMYKLKSKMQFPLILKTDPMAKYYGLKSGDIVKITRKSPTAGEYIVYRCCV